MKIGIDARLHYYRQGGIASYARQLITALATLSSRDDFRILHNYRAQDSLTPASNFRRVNTYTPCHHRIESTALGVELLPHRLDVLHSPDFIPPLWGAKRFVITVHDLAFLLFEDIQTADSLRYYAGQIQRAVTQADAIISVSAATKADMLRLLDVPAEKIHVIWEGVHEQFKPVEARHPDLPDDYLLFVGTIEPRKNIPKLLEGYRLLRDQAAAVPPLVLAGQQGWLAEASLQAIERFNIQDSVIWLQQFDYTDLPAIYSGARFLVMPSLYEGFGFPPLEAMACGVPAVVSDRGALQEVAGGAALYVDPDDAQSIADGMQRLLEDDTLRQSLRENGLAHVQQFTWQVCAEQTLAVYRSVMA